MFFLDMYRPPENWPNRFRFVVLFFRFKLFEERVIQRSQAFVNEEVTVYLRSIDTQLFFGSDQEYFKTGMRQCDHHLVWFRQFGNVHLIIDFAVSHIRLSIEKLLNMQEERRIPSV